MIPKKRSDEANHIRDMPIRLGPADLGRCYLLGKTFTVVGIETPAPPHWLFVAVDENSQAFALELVELLHVRPRATVVPGGEILARACKHRRRQLISSQLLRLGKRDDALFHRLVLDLEMGDFSGAGSFHDSAKLVLVSFPVTRVQGNVVEFVPGTSQFVGVRPHRGEEQHDLLLMMLFVSAEAHVFGHENARRGRRRQRLWWKQLVSEDDEEC